MTAGPALLSVQPSNVVVGSSITVAASGVDPQNLNNDIISFNQMGLVASAIPSAAAVHGSSVSLTVPLPAGISPTSAAAALAVPTSVSISANGVPAQSSVEIQVEPPPHALGLTPSSAAQGTSSSVSFSGVTTAFASSSSIATDDPNLTLTNVSAISSTLMTATLNVGAAVAVGSHVITITSGSSAIPFNFTVVAAATTTPVISSLSATQISPGAPLTISGSGFSQSGSMQQVVIRYTYSTIVAEATVSPTSDSQVSTNIPLLIDPSSGSPFVGTANIQVVNEGVPSNSSALSIIALPANTGAVGATTLAYLNALIKQISAMPTELTTTLPGADAPSTNNYLSAAVQQLQGLESEISTAAAGGQVTAPDGSVVTQSSIDIIDRLLQASGISLANITPDVSKAPLKSPLATELSSLTSNPSTTTVSISESQAVAAGALCKDGDIAGNMSDQLTQETIGVCGVSLLPFASPVAGPVCEFLRLFQPAQIAIEIGNVACNVAPVNLSSVTSNPSAPKFIVNGPSQTEAPSGVFSSTGSAVGQVAETVSDLILDRLIPDIGLFKYISGNTVVTDVLDDSFQYAFSTLVGNALTIDKSIPTVYYFDSNPVPLTQLSFEPDFSFTFQGMTMTPGSAAGSVNVYFDTSNYRSLDSGGHVMSTSSAVPGNLITATIQTVVTVSPSQANVAAGGRVQFSASVVGVGPSLSGVSWLVDNISGGNTTVGVITPSGLYTAPAAPGAHTISAVSTFDGSIGSANASVTTATNNPVPTITALLPASLMVGATPQTLTINGTGFLNSSTVTLNDVSHSATFVSSTQLTISLTSADLATASTYPVVVTNPAPGGGTSPAAYFAVINPQTANEWTWIGGSSTVGALGVYGTLGVPSSSNVPGSRDAATSWTDSNGNFWLFGGYGYASTGALDSLNDLWMFNPTTGNWTWISGSNTISAGAVYGSQGVPATTNVPGARMYAVGWIDKNNKLWLFGGEGVGSNNVSGFLDDLWEFDPIAKTWTWVSGNTASDTSGTYGTLGEPSTGNVPGARYYAVSWIDSSGNLWLFGGDGEDSTGFYGELNDLWEFNPTAMTWTWVSGSSSVNVDGVYGTQGVPATNNSPGSRSEAVSWIDSSGNLWLFGGNGWNSSGGGGTLLNDLWEFNPTSKTWTWVSGSSTTYTSNATISAIGVYGTEGTAAAGNTPGGRTNPASWIDSNSDLWLFGGNGYASTATTGELNDLWEFNPGSGEWTWVNGGNITNGVGIYGTSGVSASTNVPGSRYYPVSWIDSSGNLWLFGGEGYDSKGAYNLLNDLWRYQP